MSLSAFPILPSSEPPSQYSNAKQSRANQAQARYEKKWKKDPAQFDPLRTAIGRMRIERSWDLLTKHVEVKGKRVLELGCGSGVFARRLRQAGAHVEALDVSSKALDIFCSIDARDIELIRDYVPETKRPSDSYDVVVALDLIGELDPKEYRLFFHEMHRLVHPDGWILLSTPLDRNSMHAVETFSEFAQKELEIRNWFYSYHHFTEWWIAHLEIPERIVAEWKDRSLFEEKQKERKGFWKRLARWQRRAPLVYGWWVLQGIFSPFLFLLRNSGRTVRFLEFLCHKIKDIRGISHVICLGKRKPLVPPLPQDEVPLERPKKKQVWE